MPATTATNAQKPPLASALIGRSPAYERGGAGGRRRRPGSRAGRRRLGRRRFQPERNREVPPMNRPLKEGGPWGKHGFPHGSELKASDAQPRTFFAFWTDSTSRSTSSGT